MKNSILNHIGRLHIQLSREIDSEVENIDLGGILLECKGRTFRLDIDNSIISGTEIECRMVYDMDALTNTFDDSKFDLTKEDLLDKDLKGEIYITGEHYQNKALAQITSIKLSIEKVDNLKYINLCLEGTVEKYRLYKHLEDFCFEIEENDNVAQVYTDQDSESDALEFEKQYDDMPLVYCNISYDHIDITANVYMELSELLKLDEKNALEVIRNAA